MLETNRIGERNVAILASADSGRKRRVGRKIEGIVVAVLENVETGEVRRFVTKNIVTNDGDEYYAEMGAGETPTNNFGGANGRMAMLDNTGAAPAKASNFSNIGTGVGSNFAQAFDTGYPKSNDDDADNTNAAVDSVTYRRTYGTGDANGTISRVAIYLTGATGTDPILMYATFGASISKTSSDTLKVFVNHNMSGV